MQLEGMPQALKLEGILLKSALDLRLYSCCLRCLYPCLCGPCSFFSHLDCSCLYCFPPAQRFDYTSMGSNDSRSTTGAFVRSMRKTRPATGYAICFYLIWFLTRWLVVLISISLSSIRIDIYKLFFIFPTRSSKHPPSILFYRISLPWHNHIVDIGNQPGIHITALISYFVIQ